MRVICVAHDVMCGAPRGGRGAGAAGQTSPAACSRATQQRWLQKKATEEKKEAAATTALSTDIEVAPSRPIRWKYAQPWQKSMSVLPP